MWTLNQIIITELPICTGFVYKITNTITNKSYIGKKLANFSKTSIKIITLKNGTKKKKKIKSQVESDWKTYWSSSESLKLDVILLGEENFKREIIMFCYSKSELSYQEIKLQLQYDVLLFPDQWYNGIINCKIHRNHLKHMTENKILDIQQSI
jgi:hypothetical protein